MEAPKDLNEAGGPHAGTIEKMEPPPEPRHGHDFIKQTFERAWADFEAGRLDASLVRARVNSELKSLDPIANPFKDRWRQAEAQWLTESPPERLWLLQRPSEDHGDASVGFFPCGKVGMIASAGGVGKTMALCQLAIAVATGEPWFGHYKIAHPGRVLLAAGEEDEEELRRRLYWAMKLMWPDDTIREQKAAEVASNLVILPLAAAPVAFVTTDRKTGEVQELPAIEQFREEALHSQWRLIILDPLSRFAGPDTETDNAAATRFIQAVESLTILPGTPSVLLAHHTNKASRRGDSPVDTTSVRGSSALTDGVRWAATMLTEQRKDDANITTVLFELGKTNYSPPAPPLRLVRDWGGALRTPTPEERASIEISATKGPNGNGRPTPSEPNRAQKWGLDAG